MPSKNEETKLQSDPAADKILSELLPPPPPPQNPREEEDDVAAITPASVPILTDSMNDCLTPFLEYDSICHPEEDEDDEDEDVEERCYDAEEVFFTKFLNQKFITRGYKRQPVKNKAVRAETRRKYQHFRIVQKRKTKRTVKTKNTSTIVFHFLSPILLPLSYPKPRITLIPLRILLRLLHKILLLLVILPPRIPPLLLPPVLILSVLLST